MEILISFAFKRLKAFGRVFVDVVRVKEMILLAHYLEATSSFSKL